ncbi:MAG: hypothetical protein CR997_05415 [Acidobacteria bacterium]|nr:MAG: hypothetical protein CR997_05415 [Acidobacteriota bacterium]
MLKKLILILLIATAPLFAKLDDLEEVNFPLNSAVVVDAFPGLDLLAEVMKKYPDLSLKVVGYTDYIGGKNYNKNLSMKRAEAVKAYLLQQGVAASQIATEGRGQEQYKATNDNREGRFQNRRVELLLYEMVNGQKTKVSYERLIALFCGRDVSGVAMVDDHQKIIKKLSELETNQKAIQEAIAAHAKEVKAKEAAAVAVAPEEKAEKDKWHSSHFSHSFKVSPYASISFDIGNDDMDDTNGRLRGNYFRPLNDNVALQMQGEWYYSDDNQEGGFDAAMVFQRNHFKMGGALSYKKINQEGWESALLGQGSVVMNLHFNKGHFGLYATSGFSDGDIIMHEQIDIVYARETYLEVVDQIGLDFGFLAGKNVAVSGSIAKLDTDLSGDLAADLTIECVAYDNYSFYLEGSMNRSMITDDDNMRYALGVRLGAWHQPRYSESGVVSPIKIPAIKYEVKTREVRIGNTAPTADAGMSQTEVPEGTVTLDATASYDREGDTLTFKWVQVAGPVVALATPLEAITTFEGRAGEAYTFMVTVTDLYGETGSDLVQVVMQQAEVPAPVIEFFTATPDTIDEGELVNLNWSTVYADHVVIEGLGQVNTSGSIVLDPRETTVYTLTATNEKGTVSETVTVTVIPEVVPDPNNRPVANAGPDQFRITPGVVQLDGTASYDPDGDTLTYKWVVVSATTAVDMSGADTATPTFNAAASSTYIFRLIVHDGKGGVSTDDVLIQVF